MNKIFITILILIIPNLSWAAPNITGVLGDFVNGQNIIINCSSFGIKNPVAPYKYDDFSFGSDKIGQAISEDASGGVAWEYFSSCASTGAVTPETGFRYSQSHPRFSGDISGWKYFGWNDNYECYQGTNYLTLAKADGYDEAYWSMWILSETNNQNAKVRNVKIANWNNAQNGYPQGRWDLYPMNSESNGHVYVLSCGSEYSNQWGVGALEFSYGYEQWNRFEGLLDVGDVGVANGSYTVYKNNALLKSTGNLMIRNDETCLKPDTFYFTHYHDDIDTEYDPPIPYENLYHGEIYFDITRSRVELCNDSSWNARSHCEIQIPNTIWNNSQLQIKINQGSFNDGDAAYLYVMDENGEVNTSGYPITIGAGSPDIIAPNSPSGLSVM